MKKFTQLTPAERDHLTLQELDQLCNVDSTETEAVLSYINGTVSLPESLKLDRNTLKRFALGTVTVMEVTNKLVHAAGSEENVSLKFLSLLIEAGADVNLITDRKINFSTEEVNVNALHIAASIGNIDRTRLFLGKGADVHIVAKSDKWLEGPYLKNARGFAFIYRHDDVMNLLDAWVDINKIITKSRDPEKCVMDVLEHFLKGTYKCGPDYNSYSLKYTDELPPGLIQQIEAIRWNISEPMSAAQNSSSSATNNDQEFGTFNQAPDLQLYKLKLILKKLIDSDLMQIRTRKLGNENKENLKAVCNRLIKYLDDESKKLVTSAKQGVVATDTSSFLNEISKTKCTVM